MNWPVVALGDIFTIARGGSPRPIDKYITEDASGVNWIMIGDAVEGSKYITRTKKRIRPEGVSKSREVKPGDFLLTNSMSFGHPYILATSGCIHDGWLVLSPREKNVDQDYFYHLLGSPVVYGAFARLAAGAVVKNLNSELVRGVKVPFPPLTEQRRIADILDKADAIRRKRKEAIALTEELLRSAFLEMFGDPVTNPKGWDVKPLGELCDMETGFAFPSPQFQPQGVRLCRGANVLPKALDWYDVRHWASDSPVAERYHLRAGDVVLAMDRPWISSGLKVALVQEDDVPALLVQRVARIRTSSSLTNEYIYFALGQEAFARHCAAHMTETTVPHISPSDIKSHAVPVPDQATLVRFSELVSRLFPMKARAEAHLSDSEALFASLVHRAFRGELTGKSGATKLQLELPDLGAP